MALAYPVEPVGLDACSDLSLDFAGAESNLCIALARLGHRARFISRVGDDPLGRRIRLGLEREGVDTSALRVDPSAPTGVFFRENLPDGFEEGIAFGMIAWYVPLLYGEYGWLVRGDVVRLRKPPPPVAP